MESWRQAGSVAGTDPAAEKEEKMDVNALLARIRELYVPEGAAQDPEGNELSDLVHRLDEHLSGGGAPPEAWVEGPDAPELDAVGVCGARLHQQSTYDGSMYLSVCTLTPGHDGQHQDETRGGAPRSFWGDPEPLGPVNPAGVELPEAAL